MIIKICYNIIAYLTLLYSLYFAVTAIIGLIKKNKNSITKSSKKNYFAILIPARNEENVIGNLLDSLKELNYPKSKYSIHVIPNNCTDNTANIIKNYDVNTMECHNEVKTKADVLRYAFSNLKNDNHIDAYIIFDADNVVHPEFLTNMNNCLHNGSKVAQGYRDAKNPSDTWISGSYTLFYMLQNTFFNYSRMNLNSSSTLNGTGLMIKKSFIDEIGFNTKSLTEDLEFTGICALKNEKIAYVPDAITYDEYPNRFTSSWSQRKRWTSGIVECTKLYFIKLLKNFFKTGNLSSLDLSLIYISPAIQVLSFINFIIILCVKIIEGNLNSLNNKFLITTIITTIISYIAIIIIELFTIYMKGKKPRKLLSGIIFFPLFIATWIPINIMCFIKKETKWKVINHDRNIKINDILK